MSNCENKKCVSTIGGQAVIEGVMMRGKTAMATAVRDEAGNITVESSRLTPPEKQNKFLKLPLIRGVVNLVTSLIGGTKVLMRSATVFGDDETNKFDDLEMFAKSQKNGTILIQDFATFIQAIGKVHYLAANSEVRKEKDKAEFGDGQFRIFYRGQNRLYGKHCDEMKPSAYRGNGDCTKSIEENINHILTLKPFCGSNISREAIEGLIQQYGGVSRWIDVVDNIWIALWFSCHRAWVAKDVAETEKAKGYTRSSMQYVHYEKGFIF